MHLPFVCVILVFGACFKDCLGHGRLLEPASRSSAWRRGFPGAVTNYDDNALYCGGFYHQYEVNEGKCGICGDPYDGARDNEAGGKYARGIITATYKKGQKVTIHVQITAHHKGWFEFRICPNNDISRPATQECLDKHLLSVVTNQGLMDTRYDISKEIKKDYHITAHLPDNLVCEQCVLQWKYNAGNSWGVDSDTGRGCLGCGQQEQFYGCADVRIKGAVDIETTPITESHEGDVKETTPITESHEGDVKETTTITQSHEGDVQMTSSVLATTDTVLAEGDQTTIVQGTDVTQEHTKEQQTRKDPQTTQASPTTKPLTTKGQPKEQQTTKETKTTQDTPTTEAEATEKRCVPTSVWNHIPGITDWCKNNGKLNHCPSPYCTSSTKSATRWDTCRAVGIWASYGGMNQWCRLNCSKNNCPSAYCFCPTL